MMTKMNFWTLYQCILSFSSLKEVSTFSLSHRTPNRKVKTTGSFRISLLQISKSDAIDVEFESNDSKGTEGSERKMSPLDASLSMEPELSMVTFDFVDTQTSENRSIECRLSFMLEKDGEHYCIGTPVDSQVAVFCEGDDSGSYFMDPDNDDNLELMEMAAAAFNKEYGDMTQITFKRTPRSLTVVGDLDIVTSDWRKETNVPEEEKPINIVGDLLEEMRSSEDSKEDDEFFDAFFKKELGENYEQEFLVPDDEIDAQVEEMMPLFNIPGIGTEQKDEEGMKKIFEEIYNDVKSEGDSDNSSNEGAETALRLVGFPGPDKKSYSLVKLIQPMILVAKEDNSLEFDQRRLLSPEEAKTIVPQLEADFKEEFEKAGLI